MSFWNSINHDIVEKLFGFFLNRWVNLFFMRALFCTLQFGPSVLVY